MSVALYREDGLASSTAIKGACRAATTANIALEGEQTLDGIACVSGDRVLVKNQTDGSENGIYIVDTGNWRRSADFEGNRDVRKGTRLAVTDGDTYENTVWVVSTDNPIVVDESTITFVQDEATVAAAEAAADAAQAALDRAAAESAKTAAEAALTAIQAIQNNGVGRIDAFATREAPDRWYACDGTELLIADEPALYAKLVTESGFTSQTFTVTIASPAVVTKTGHGLLGGERVRLSTSGALPTGLDASTDYFVKYVDANTFQLSSTFGGTSINTSGGQSGTHTYLQSLWGLGDGSATFNLPLINDDDRLPAPAGTSRQVGTNRAESVGPHTHTGSAASAGSHSHSVTMSANARYGANSSGSPEPDFGTGDTIKGSTSRGMSVSSAGAHTHDVTVAENDGTVNLPPTVALLYCIYAGPAS